MCIYIYVYETLLILCEKNNLQENFYKIPNLNWLFCQHISKVIYFTFKYSKDEDNKQYI